MVKNRTLAKQRLDKYYNLAKEKGYRARSAFKLLQLDKKYGFLKNSQILIDLCAAPGGWLQVAAQEMPRPRKIIGIDLDQIKFIGDVETIVCDITTEECRKRLYGMLEGRLADVILHDGAPNVGTSWENDAFNQNLLVFHSLNLARLFLKPGGLFVTKVFRSKDYDALIKIFSKMFKKVEATKPLSSRSQSAEIFVVCLDFVGVGNFDEEILEHFGAEEGIEDDEDDCKYRKISFTEFMQSDKDLLDKITEIEMDLSEEDRKKILSDEFVYLFKDLKVISEKEKKKIRKKKESLIKKIKRGEIEIEKLSFLRDCVEEVEEEAFEMVPLDLDQKLEMIDEELRENRTKPKPSKCAELQQVDNFYEDDLFKNLDSNSEEILIEEPVEEVEVSSCSDSLDLNEEELMCIARYKENPEMFIESTVDRHWTDPEEKLPNYLREDQYASGRSSKADPEKYSKKEKEALMRRKCRAERRAEKFMKDQVIEESDEERLLAKEVFKKEFRRTKNKARIVFPKHGKFGIPKGKGKLICFDRRLKADKRARR
ncbi:AdoMet-dependent rRNA methyltransferase spb1 [Nosema granulosis]|uniref:AdoMet-dependent rRNA methyltransferase spb1 n=1 Tax=Nosema granulosis TaxID=83296 RepID=A0A9P6H204_9MICR|nr:AdoMet-dependent rRNA methyltransferase spb1 [Nosema granulosis]